MKYTITILLLLSVTFSGISQKIGDKYWNDASLEKAKQLKTLMVHGSQGVSMVGLNAKYFRVSAFIDTVWRGYSMSFSRIDSIAGKDLIYDHWKSVTSTVSINALSDSIYFAFKRQINAP